MPDKMMRMAGRGDDGTAKAITTNDEGVLRTANKSGRMKLFDGSLNVPRYGDEGVTSDIFDARGYESAKLEFVFGHPRVWRITLNHYLFREHDDTFVKTGEEMLYSTLTSVEGITLEVNLNSFFSVTVHNGSANDGNLLADSSYTLSQDLVPEKSVVQLKFDNSFVVPAGGTSDITFKPNNCKEFLIHFRADSAQNLNDIKISEYYNLIARESFLLRESIIGSYQPLISATSSGAVYNGTTPMIPVMSPQEIRLVIKNYGPTELTMSYAVVGYR